LSCINPPRSAFLSKRNAFARNTTHLSSTGFFVLTPFAPSGLPFVPRDACRRSNVRRSNFFRIFIFFRQKGRHTYESNRRLSYIRFCPPEIRPHRSRDHGDDVTVFFGPLPQTEQKQEEAGGRDLAFRSPMYRYTETTAKRTKTENRLSKESPLGACHAVFLEGGK
jgi:hypothetical protein